MSAQNSDFDRLYHAALKELETNVIIGDPQIADLLAKRDLILADCKDDYLRRHKEAVDRYEEITRLRLALIQIRDHYDDTELAAKHMAAIARAALSRFAPGGDDG